MPTMSFSIAENQCNMNRKGDCQGNAVAESFFHTLKVALTHGKTYNTPQDAKTAIFEYIEGFYNQHAAIPISVTLALMSTRKRMWLN